mgnify:CR=1 FL=1
MAVQKSKKTLSKKKIRRFKSLINPKSFKPYKKYYYGKFPIVNLMYI